MLHHFSIQYLLCMSDTVMQQKRKHSCSTAIRKMYNATDNKKSRTEKMLDFIEKGIVILSKR